MEENGYESAMTEIALALAMAFFCIMVLAMISMGVPGTEAAQPTTGAVLAEAERDAAEASRVAPEKQDQLVIFYQGRFWDRELNALDPAKVAAGGRVILALDPALPMKDALSARSRIDVPDLVVAALDERWLETLRSRIHVRN